MRLTERMKKPKKNQDECEQSRNEEMKEEALKRGQAREGTHIHVART
jgi:hypothetical protein